MEWGKIPSPSTNGKQVTLMVAYTSFYNVFVTFNLSGNSWQLSGYSLTLTGFQLNASVVNPNFDSFWFSIGF